MTTLTHFKLHSKRGGRSSVESCAALPRQARLMRHPVAADEAGGSSTLAREDPWISVPVDSGIGGVCEAEVKRIRMRFQAGSPSSRPASFLRTQGAMGK